MEYNRAFEKTYNCSKSFVALALQVVQVENFHDEIAYEKRRKSTWNSSFINSFVMHSGMAESLPISFGIFCLWRS